LPIMVLCHLTMVLVSSSLPHIDEAPGPQGASSLMGSPNQPIGFR
jgi:hypothetical protein